MSRSKDVNCFKNMDLEGAKVDWYLAYTLVLFKHRCIIIGQLAARGGTRFTKHASCRLEAQADHRVVFLVVVAVEDLRYV